MFWLYGLPNMTPAAGDGSQSEGNRLAPSLPPELWGMVVHDLSNEAMRSFSSVSRLFHDLILPVRHSSFWPLGADDKNADGDRSPGILVMNKEVPELENNPRNTCEVLLQIIRTPSFARLVKTLSVRAYSMVQGPGKDMVELCKCNLCPTIISEHGSYAFTATVLLKEAISAMTNITSFRWEGRRPLPAAFVLEALFQSSSQALRDISLP